MRISRWILWCACLILLGCGTGDSPVVVTPDASSPDAAEANAVEVQVKSWQETQDLIAGHKGKIVVLDAWASW